MFLFVMQNSFVLRKRWDKRTFYLILISCTLSDLFIKHNFIIHYGKLFSESNMFYFFNWNLCSASYHIHSQFFKVYVVV